MNPKTLAPVLLVAGLALAYCSGMFDSEETRIRNVIVDTAGAFDDTILADCLEGFAEDYRDETERRVDRETLTQALQIVFMRMVDPKTKAFVLRARLQEDPIAVAIGETGETASADFTVHLERRTNGEWQPQWQLRVAAKLRKIEGDWRIQTSTHETVEGSRPR